MLAPRDEADLAELVAATRAPLEPVAGGSKRCVGRPVAAEALDLSALRGILDYEPRELVLTARAATPLEEIEGALAAHSQRLAFEPPDWTRLLATRGRPTLGGTLAANASGSRRITAGAARDHFLGLRAVSGRAERFKAGGRVVKNVTGYDLPKLLAGSWGTLAVLTEVTVRVHPAPEQDRTLLVEAPAGPVHALYYPPTSARWRGPRDEAPPAVLHAHSGPTRRAPARFALDVQFWTTRGYAYLDVNYAGSTGYGRAYRERLRGRWGEGDVEDCAACVAACARRGLLDPARVVSIGASASGVTTLGLARRGVLAAASLRYPVTDLGGLAAAPARVEAHYLEGLVGPLPEADALYGARSALGFVDELSTPLALFHGTEDEVVPLTQSLELAAALDARTVPHCLVVVVGEGHGFRDPATWRREAAIEESFFARVLGLGPFDPTFGVEIRHVEALAPGPP